MSVMTLVLVLIAFCAISSAPPLIYANRKQALFFTDLALPIAPPAFLFGGILLLNQPAQTGWGVIAYPLICALLCITMLYVRFFLLINALPPSRSQSAVFFTVACMLAFGFAVVVEPWYD